MARRERERYTERARPHRKDADAVRRDEPDTVGGRNPVVMIAVGGLVLAAVLAGAVMIGMNMGGGQTAAPPAEDVPPLADSGTVPTESSALPTLDLAAPAPENSVPAYSGPTNQGLDPTANTYFVVMETTKGTVELQLWPDLAPEHANSFAFLINEGFYDGLTIHRVEPGFVIQGGDPQGNGTGGPGYSVPAEFSNVPHVEGILSMARTNDPNSAGSQFFIVLGPAPHLDNQYSVFGFVTKGMDVVQSIVVGDVMESVTLETRALADSVVTPDDIRAGNIPANR